ncbi:MAG: hypothetical protein HC923_06310 [Myxococcales bacterium]|nr:hypothetical protein [Myxococcales bacterium]
MQDLIRHFPTFVMIGIIVVVGASQFHRGVGAILGMLFWSVVGGWGYFMYRQGGAIGFPGLPLPEPLFYGLCCAFLALQIVTFLSFRSARKRRREFREELRR